MMRRVEEARAEFERVTGGLPMYLDISTDLFEQLKMEAVEAWSGYMRMDPRAVCLREVQGMEPRVVEKNGVLRCSDETHTLTFDGLL